MKFIAIFMMLLWTGMASAAIECKARVQETLPDGNQRFEQKDLKSEYDNGYDIILSTELDGRSFVFSGNQKDDVYMISITWGPEFTTGTLSTASFSSQGRLQISMVEKQLVYKMECFKR